MEIDQIIWSMWLIVGANVRFGYSYNNCDTHEPIAGITRMRVHKENKNVYVLLGGNAHNTG